MLAYGADRIRVADDGRVILSSRYPKNWQARVPKTLTTSEHPGTAVLWDDQFYEVVEASSQVHGGARYVLERWKDEHAIRVTDRYDEESEAARVAAHEQLILREKKRKGTAAAGILAGHLPAIVQDQLGSELGVLPVRLTMLSLLIPFAVIALVVWHSVSQIMSERAPSMPWIVVAGYLFAESLVRFLIVMTGSRPCGSLAGILAYVLAYAVGPRSRMISPFGSPKGMSTRVVESPDEELRLADELMLKEPMATLLSVSEQRALESRFGFDYRRQGVKTAIRLLIISLIGSASSIATLRHTPRLSAAAALVCALLLALEQIARLNALRRGPAASVLALLARPFLRKLLAAGPPAPVENPIWDSENDSER